MISVSALAHIDLDVAELFPSISAASAIAVAASADSATSGAAFAIRRRSFRTASRTDTAHHHFLECLIAPARIFLCVDVARLHLECSGPAYCVGSRSL